MRCTSKRKPERGGGEGSEKFSPRIDAKESENQISWDAFQKSWGMGEWEEKERIVSIAIFERRCGAVLARVTFWEKTFSSECKKEGEIAGIMSHFNPGKTDYDRGHFLRE